MCPSYRATREEEHSTRGRARLLFEMVDNDADSPITDGWRSDEVHDALDLCLACKGCKTDCPVNVDMATYKAEFLHHHYKGRPRPSRTTPWAGCRRSPGVVALAPRTVNAWASVPWVARAAKALGGVAPERDVPVFAEQRFTDWWRERGGPRGEGHRGEVVVWPDTFTDHFHPAIGRAAVEVLEAAGFRVKVPRAAVCCGLTWISTGQLNVARRVLGHTIDVLREDLRRGTPVIGLEPSCTAVFRADAAELLPKDPDVGRLREQTRTLAELLLERAGTGRRPASTRARWSSATATSTPSWASTPTARSCGAPGSTPTSWTPAAADWPATSASRRGTTRCPWPAPRRDCCPPCGTRTHATLVLADGFSCRTQVDQAGTGRTPLHLAEVLAAGLTGREAVPERPRPPGPGPCCRGASPARPRAHWRCRPSCGAFAVRAARAVLHGERAPLPARREVHQPTDGIASGPRPNRAEHSSSRAWTKACGRLPRSWRCATSYSSANSPVGPHAERVRSNHRAASVCRPARGRPAPS
ncbi:hypothetical protein GCM10023238_35580 [Streptomyces heliomycini]